jgi:hypothetical protein
MEVFEITGYQTGISKAGVNFLQPSDSFQNIINGFVYRQVLQSRQGAALFAPRLATGTRILGIFEHTKPDSTKELLAVDTQQLYKYNTATGVFDPVPFGGSMAAYPGFNNTTKDFYISGVSYPTATNTERFVFTGEGIQGDVSTAGSSIFFYDGTFVKNFTSVVDNPNFAQYIGGTLTSASYVLWFNERLNFIIPLIGAVQFEQGILYSGIRTTSGNGDKFNVVGSGLLQADTYEVITGVSILGQVIVLNFNRSAWTLEKTTDAFNPYFIRKIPSVLGTNAKFSAVGWNDIVDSMGKTGILECDGRLSLRKDNKIPTFTEEDIDQISFNLTYGGFDRLNEQFLWAYKISESDSATQNSVLVRNYEEDSWSLFDQRFSVFGQTDLGINFTWDDIDESNDPSWAQWDTTEELWNRIGLGVAIQKTLAGDDLGFIYELNRDFDDNSVNISAIASGATTTLTIDESSYIAGDFVTVENVQGMIQINNYDPALPNLIYIPWTVLSATPTSIVINADSTLFDPYVLNTGRVSKLITFTAETIPFNPYRSQGRMVNISIIEFLIDVNGGNLKVSIFSDEEESPFIKDVILYPDQSSTKSREWVALTVNSEANFFTIKMLQQSPAVQLRLTSMRIHARKGIMTNE